jgi:hypothetical protein
VPQVKRILVAQRENPIVNRLNKTKVERKPDLKQEREDRLRELRKQEQASQQQRVSSPPLHGPCMLPRGPACGGVANAEVDAEAGLADASFACAQKKEDARVAQERKEKKWQKDHAYDELFTDESMAASSNQDRGDNWEDDFM